MADFRLQRVENLIRNEIGLMIIQGVIKDPRVGTFISVSGVKVSKDLGYAKVYISSFQNEKKLELSVKALNHASGFIQGRVGKALKTRQTPKITFVADHSVKEGIEINNIIKDLDK